MQCNATASIPENSSAPSTSIFTVFWLTITHSFKFNIKVYKYFRPCSSLKTK
jgi:hypothetical protein